MTRVHHRRNGNVRLTTHVDLARLGPPRLILWQTAATERWGEAMVSRRSRTARLSVVVALGLLGVTLLPAPATATTLAPDAKTCPNFNGVVNAAPAVPVKVKSKTSVTLTIKNAAATGCTGGVTGGTLSGTFKYSVPAGSCQQFLKGFGAKGTVTIAWKPSGTTTFAGAIFARTKTVPSKLDFAILGQGAKGTFPNVPASGVAPRSFSSRPMRHEAVDIVLVQTRPHAWTCVSFRYALTPGPSLATS